MTIKVLGTGCATCQRLYYFAQRAAQDLGMDASQVEYSTDVRDIIALGLMTSPVLVLDGQPQLLKSHSIDAIKELILNVKTKK